MQPTPENQCAPAEVGAGPGRGVVGMATPEQWAYHRHGRGKEELGSFSYHVYNTRIQV